MSQWGSSSSYPDLPKNLTLEQKTRVYADNRGWNIIRPGHRDYLAGRSGSPVGEVIVAVHGLQTNLNTSNITSAYFVSNSYSTGGTAKVRVHWDQLVTPTTTGTLIVKRYTGTSIVNVTATRVGNTTSNFVEFSFTASSSTGVVYTIPAQTITLGIYSTNAPTAGSSYTVTSSLVLTTSDVIVAGTKYRTPYGGNVLGTYSPYTDTSVTLTA